MWDDYQVIRPEEGAFVATVGIATIALPARPHGEPWEYVAVSNLNSNYIAFGNVNLVSFFSPIHMAMTNRHPLGVLNIRGHTHYNMLSGPAQIICPIGRQSGGGRTMRAPPQITASAFEGTGSAGSAALPKDGSHPTKYVMLTFIGATGTHVAVGDSTVDAGTGPQLAMTEGSGVVVLNVAGHTHFAWTIAAGGSLIVSALGY